ncbi:hypothetical protein RhiLY_04759 [Ceratobasidium sp. AG-Ba]|nr:hypothetical protein RhiLY_04759 [Ceratobasidium sp. AG-Ba]
MQPELSSSQEFIRALKGSKDPPNEGGLSKVELAHKAWKLDSLFIPSKAEVIVEWALQSLLARSHSESPDGDILSDQLWKLLSDVICARMDFNRPISAKTPGLGWLNNVVNRVPVLPIFAGLLRSIAHTVPFTERATPPGSLRLVLEAATSVARVLLPLASIKANCDTVASCFWETLGIFAAQDATETTLLLVLDLCDRIASVFETSFTYYSNKKKIATVLVEKHQSAWLHAAEPRRSELQSLVSFRQKLFDIGCTVVFCPEYTRLIFQSFESHPTLLAVVSSPRLFAAYVSGLRTHKLFVFSDQGAGTSTGGIAKRVRGAARDLYLHLVPKCQWPAIAQITQSAEELQVVDDDWADIFGTVVQSAIQTLKQPWSDEQARVAIHVCLTLGSVLRLNVEVVQAHAAVLLSGLCTAPSSLLPAAGPVLELLLDHHSKARTLHIYLPQLTNSLVTAIVPRKFYQDACVGPVLDATHLAKLRRSVAAFVTPGQILPTVRQLLTEFATAIATWASSISAEPPRKKRRTSTGDSNVDYLGEASAAHIGLSSRLLVSILKSLPVKTLKPDALESLKSLVDEFDADTLSKAFTTGLEHDSWAHQTILAAVSRIRYCLRHSQCPVPTSCGPTAEEDDSLLGLLGNPCTLAELVTETVRVSTQGQRPQDHIRKVWQFALARLDRDIVSQRNITWDGSLAHLDKDPWFPLWFLLLDKQLSVIESNLGPDQLGLILDMFVNLGRGPKASDSISSIQLFTKAISTPQFWEMHKLRGLLNEKMVSGTMSLDQASLHKVLKTMRKGKKSKHAGSHDDAISLYRLAALCPPDYLDRSAKTALFARAPCADVLATNHKDRAAVRVVLRQLGPGTSVGLPEEYIEYLLDPSLQGDERRLDDPDFENDTLTILQGSFRLYARSAKDTGKAGDIGAVLQRISTLELFQEPVWGNPAAILSTRATVCLLDTISEIWGPEVTLPKEIHGCVLRILDQIRNCAEHSDVATDLLIEAVRTLTSCEHWLQLDTSPASCRARRVLRALPTGNSVATKALIRLIIEEIRNAGEDVRLLIAAVGLHARSHGTSVPADILRAFGEACRGLKPEQHALLTSEIVSLVLAPENNLAYRVATIRIASSVLRYAPESTSQHRRQSTTTILNSLAQLPQSQPCQEACASFVAEMCSERAASLTILDMTAIWILLDRATTSSDMIFLSVYSLIVASLSSLIRFRRDLLTPALAQLSALLSRLIRTLRYRISHAAGAPQRTTVAQASLAGKATELARVLVGLTTKNTPVTIRSKADQKQPVKAESLARPFARHAPYILVAYAQSAAEMSGAVRAALKPGLFALCSMCGMPARDMIMVTMLDTVEKEIFGGVWKEWEGQKYIGKG